MSEKNNLNIQSNTVGTWNQHIYQSSDKNSERKKSIENLCFEVDDELDSFIGREDELQKLHISLKTHHRTLVYGLGGSGKTELVRKYAWNQRGKCYNNIVWITGDTKDNIKRGFQQLAVEIKVELQDKGVERSDKHVRNDIYKTLSVKNCLIIFDNIEDYKDISEILPSKHIDNKNIYIVITSQNNFNNFEKIHLDVFSEPDGYNLMCRLLRIENPSTKITYVVLLVKILHFFPLAIQQAAAYIRHMQDCSAKYSILDYIKEFQVEEKLLLDCDEFEAYGKTIYVTFSLTLKKIQQCRQEKLFSLDILYVSGFIAPDNIPKSIFLSLTASKKFSLDIALHNLHQYSLIGKSSEDNFKIHRLVQLFLRNYVAENKHLKDKVRKNVLKIVLQEKYVNSPHCIFALNYMDTALIIKYYRKTSSKAQEMLLLYLGINGHLEALSTISDKNIWKKKELYYPILCVASGFGHLSLVKYFLDNPIFIEHLGPEKNIIATDENKILPIHCSAANGHLHIIKYFKETGFNINATTEDECTLLHTAVINNHNDIVSYLLDEEINVDARDIHGYLPIHWCLIKGYLHLLQVFVQKGCMLDVTTNDGLSLLHLAVIYNHEEVVRYLVDEKIGINIRDNEGYLPIHISAECGHLHLLKLLQQTGSTVDVITDKGHSLLHLAVQFNHEEIIRYLIYEKIDINIRDNEGWLPIHFSAACGHLHLLKLLQQTGSTVDVITDKGHSLLHIAVDFNHEEVVRYLIDEKIDINVRDVEGKMPIHFTAIRGHLHLLKLLQQTGSTVDVITNKGHSLLHLAVQCNQEEVVRYLIDKKIGINVRDNEGYLPIHLSAAHGHLHLLKFLQQTGSTVDVITDKGHSLLHIAVDFNHEEVVRYLIDEKIDINVRDIEGKMPIHFTAIRGHLHLLKLLQQKGSTVDVITDKGHSLLHIAVQFNHEEVVRYLINEKIDINVRDCEGYLAIHFSAIDGHLQP